MFAVGYIASRHDQDVQKQEQDDSEEESKTLNLAEALERKRQRIASKTEYQRFMESALK